MMTRALASEWAEYNINVNAVAPSLVAKPEVLTRLSRADSNNGRQRAPKTGCRPKRGRWHFCLSRLSGFKLYHGPDHLPRRRDDSDWLEPTAKKGI